MLSWRRKKRGGGQPPNERLKNITGPADGMNAEVREKYRNERPTRDEVYIRCANIFSARSTCPRKSVGAVLVRDKHILGSGYNGAPSKLVHCLDNGCDMVGGHCVRTVHAEVNAVLAAAANGVSTVGATLYSTAKPCFRCEKFLLNAGVEEIYYIEDYDDGKNNQYYMLAKTIKQVPAL